MGYTQKLGLLAQSVFQDSSLNVGIGAAPSGTYKFEVTGTAKVSTSAYFAIASGSVGIGTATPSYKFEVSNLGAGVTVGDFYVDTANNSVYVGRQSTTSGDNSKFYVRNRVNTLTALSVDPGGNGAVDVVGTFSTTRGTNLATATGNVGIGTSSPTIYGGGLEVSRAGQAGVRVSSTGTGAGGVELGYSGGAAYIQTVTAGSDLQIVTGAASVNAMILKASGNVGIGTSTPDTVLQVLGQVGIGTADGNYTQGTLRVGYSTGGYPGQLYLNADNNTGGAYIAWNAGIKTSVDTATYAYTGAATKIDGQLGIFKFYTAASGTAGANITFSERMRITSSGQVYIGTTTDSGVMIFPRTTANVAISTYDNNTLQISTLLTSTGNLRIEGSLSKGSGSFRIDHPLEFLSNTHDLVHSFVEAPQADLYYRGKLTLVNGKGQANIDEVSTMTEGTFEALCREVQCFTTNESGWDLIKGKVIGNIIYIESQNINSTDEISWMVIGERKDKHMMDTEWTDDNGRVIVEPLKRIEPTKPTKPIIN